MSARDLGEVIVLNGAPRSGKSAIAEEIVSTFQGDWVSIGVDSMMAATPAELLPGIGLRPGAARPDLEIYVQEQYHQLFADVAKRAWAGTKVVMDVGIHDDYSKPLGIADAMSVAFAGLDVLLVGVHCSLEMLRTRRAKTGYLSWAAGADVPDPVQRWQQAVHTELTYDVEVTTSALTSAECVAQLRPPGA